MSPREPCPLRLLWRLACLTTSATNAINKANVRKKRVSENMESSVPRRAEISDGSLTAFMDVDVFDSNELGAAISEAA
jgi:hypothetical protein